MSRQSTEQENLEELEDNKRKLRHQIYQYKKSLSNNYGYDYQKIKESDKLKDIENLNKELKRLESKLEEKSQLILFKIINSLSLHSSSKILLRRLKIDEILAQAVRKRLEDYILNAL
jgi:GTPase involved in cell partitioning and DNA repair